MELDRFDQSHKLCNKDSCGVSLPEAPPLIDLQINSGAGILGNFDFIRTFTKGLIVVVM